MPRPMFAAMLLAAAAFALAGPVEARSSGKSPRVSTSSTHSSSGSSHAGRSRATTPKAAQNKTRFIRRTCKTEACKKKHPSGEYFLVLKPKKSG